MILVANNHAAVGEWVRGHIPKVQGWVDGFRTLRAELNGQILGAVVYDSFTPYDCNMHIALLDRRCISKRTLKAAFAYPFKQMGLRRVTALIAESNTSSIRFATKIGFRLEGRKRWGLGDEDELIYGLTREACRFL